MINVEQNALRAFEQNALAGLAHVIKQAPHRIEIGQHRLAHCHQFFENFCGIQLRLAKPSEQCVVMHEQPFHLATQGLGIGQIARTNGAAANLVFIGWPDAPARRANLGRARSLFTQTIKFAVQGHDKSRIFGNAQIVPVDHNPLFSQAGYFLGQMPWVNHHAIANDGKFAGPHDARRQKRELVNLAVDHQRVAGVMPTLETHHHIGAFGKPIDNLALALIAPLRANHCDIRHRQILHHMTTAPAGFLRGRDRLLQHWRLGASLSQ